MILSGRVAVIASLVCVPAAASGQAGGAGAVPPTALATYVVSPPDVNGLLDEPFWAEIEPLTGFRQREPADGAPATERTEVRIAYDENNLYFGFTLFDDEPDRILATILQREGRIDLDDRIIIALDTYLDRRNAYIFELNALGTQGDALITDERIVHSDWNWEGVYHSEARITEFGWVLEVAIPFTTIRFAEGESRQMGVAFYRSIRRKNEDVTWPRIPIRYDAGIFQVSQYATLTGLRNIRRGRNVEVKPFAIAGAQKLFNEASNVLRDMGLDVKYGLTSNLTLDLTFNTDFAQVESDNVQINLTRFNLFFPEKREFFLERAGLFSLGAPRETEAFFSRRIGIGNDILGGGRLTGQVGPFSIGLLNLQTDDSDIAAGANNTVVRVRADVLPRTTVGAIATNLQNGDGYNRVVGADADVRFWGNSTFFTWVTKVWDSDGPSEGTAAGAAEVVLRNDLFMLEAAYNNVGENFAPGMGFVRRTDQVRFGGQFGVTPRFASTAWARQLSVFLQGNHIAGQDGVKQSHFRRLDTRLRLQSGDAAGLNVTQQFDRLQGPFYIRPDVAIPIGDYTFHSVAGNLSTDESRDISARLNLSVGQFYSGTRRNYGGSARLKFSEHLTIGARVSRNDISLLVSNGDFSTTILGLNVDGAASRKLFANALIQYDDVSKTIQANVRINWIHTPGSDLFVVFDGGYVADRDMLDPFASRWVRRTGVAKLTYLVAL